MPNFLLGLLSREWFGLVIAAAVGTAAWAAPGPVGIALGLAALVMAAGALKHLMDLARAARAHPPPGRLIDLGGYRVHVLGEGEAKGGRPAIVWFAGGHAGGMAIHHLHRALRSETRSLLIDRPGTGWSDTGPFPRTTAREAEEIVLALQRAGEAGPFVFAGHSFGGLLCANIARRHPGMVHTLVLLDPTPLETLIFGPRFSAIKEMQRAALVGGLAHLFGIDLAERHRRQQAANPHYAKLLKTVEDVLGPEVSAVRRVEARAGHSLASASIYKELSPEGATACAWDTAVYDGDLGSMRVLLVAPKNDVDVSALPEANTGDAAEAQRIARRLASTRERYLAVSSRSERVVAPAHTGHNFIYEEPHFVVQLMRELLDREPTP